MINKKNINIFLFGLLKYIYFVFEKIGSDF